MAPTSNQKVNVETEGPVRIVELNRPEVRNAVDAEAAALLHEAFMGLDEDDSVAVGVLTGAGGSFCSGADLHALTDEVDDRVRPDGPGPMGPTRLFTTKPVIAAIEGHAVAGGLELALWCDLRVAAEDAVLGVFCRRLGVPLIDGGTVRLPRLIGHSRAMDMILTGRGVGIEEAMTMGLVNRVAPSGAALEAAVSLAAEIAAHPQTCLRNDRRSALEQWGRGEEEALRNETTRGLATIASGEPVAGARSFGEGAGRHGESL
ncbi:MAG: crotonase/enoyl-CoA hydratase family protein [Acidimicrobiia bacterium]